MPYESSAQFRYMHMKHPEIAKRWDAEGYKMPSNEHVDEKKVRDGLMKRMKNRKKK